MNAQFRRGDIVDFVWTGKASTREMRHAHDAIRLQCPYKLIILRPLDEGGYLAAICKSRQAKTQMCIETSIGQVFVKVHTFYAVEAACLISCDNVSYKEDRKAIVERIYSLHNEFIVQRQAKRRMQMEERRKKKEVMRKRKDVVQRYSEAYNIAIMNNDLERMREIEKVLGYAPGMRGGGSKQTRKALYRCANPRPYQGGTFSPK